MLYCLLKHGLEFDLWSLTALRADPRASSHTPIIDNGLVPHFLGPDLAHCPMNSLNLVKVH